MIAMILRIEIIKVHHKKQMNHGSDNWKAARKNPVESLRYE